METSPEGPVLHFTILVPTYGQLATQEIQIEAFHAVVGQSL